MKASELRIGNYVTDEFYDSFKSIFEVDSINEKGINLLIEDDGNWTELAERWIGCEYDFNDLHGIPLTEQWLIDFGFKKINGKYFKVGFQLKGNKVIDDIGYHFKREGLSIEISYVHQLQNLYHSLTGEELVKK